MVTYQSVKDNFDQIVKELNLDSNWYQKDNPEDVRKLFKYVKDFSYDANKKIRRKR